MSGDNMTRASLAMQDSQTSVALCICTYRRPEGLKTLLSALEQLTFERITQPVIQVYVIENDHDDNGRSICEEYRNRLVWPLQYELERRPGVSHARNRCLEVASRNSQFIAFLDDDERPSPQWLEALLIAQQAHAADVVAGPVIPVFDRPPPSWAANSPYHARRIMRTGTRLQSCGAGNVLFATELVTRHCLRFDAALGLCGGEDDLFFTSARRAGAVLIWCADAVVEEAVPVERTTLRWLMRRAYRIGVAKHRGACRLEGKLRAVAQSVWLGGSRIGIGFLSLPWAAVSDWDRAVTALCRMAFGLGCLVGVGGGNINAYRPS